MSTPKKIFVIPFSHLDLFWAGTRSECLTRGVTIIKTALDMLEKYPAYRFMIEATNFLELFLEACPEQRDRVRRHVSDERLEVIPMRSITYTQLPSGETLVRNILYGREFCQRELGFVSKVISMSDIPGITPQMPQIAARSGMDALFLSHGCPPHTDHITYQALDGTRIKSYAPIHYAKCRALLAKGEDYDQMLEHKTEFLAYFDDVDYNMLCQWGADVCVIGEHVIQNIKRWNDDGHTPLSFSTFTEYFSQHYPADPKLIAGEIPSLWPNVESTWPDIWPLDLPCEQAMFDAEFFSVITGNTTHIPTLRKAWDWLLDSMDHNQNGIGGDVSDGDKRDLKIAAKLAAQQVSKQMSWALAAKATAPAVDAFPIVIFNTLSWDRSERICARATIYGPGTAKCETLQSDPQSFRLIDEQGNEVPMRIIKHRAMIADSIEVEFYAQDVPALGAKVYYLQPISRRHLPSPFQVEDGKARDQVSPHLYAGNTTIQSDFLKLDIDRVTGEFSVYDKQQQRMILNRAGILALEEKRGDYICKMDLTGRVIPAVVEKIKLIDHSPIAYRIQITGTVYGQRYTQTLTLDANTPTLQIENKIDWQGGCYARFEQAFPFASDQEAQTHYGVPFGSVQYPQTIYTNGLSFEDLVTPERADDPDDAITRIRLVSKWIALRDSQSTLTIGTGNRMWELDGNTIRNCMFRSIGNTSGGVIIHEDNTKEGVHRPPIDTYTFRYKLSVTDATQTLDGHCGWEHNAPLQTVGVGHCDVAQNPGLKLPTMPNTTGSSLIISNIKPALENPNDTVFRCFETAGQTDTLTLPKIAHKQWYEANMMEEQAVICTREQLTFEPYEIKTLLLKTND
tara:strand:+ start:12061 stop:14613 length:2553 start_codon:yes stop_codon:yes gene_type:complete